MFSHNTLEIEDTFFRGNYLMKDCLAVRLLVYYVIKYDIYLIKYDKIRTITVSVWPVKPPQNKFSSTGYC